MRKVLTLLLTLALLCTSLSACGGASSVAPASSPAGLTSSSASTASAAVSYVELTDVLAPELYGIGFRNGDIALGLEVQKQLDAMMADGTSAKISEKWFAKDAVLKDQKFLEETAAPAGDKSLETIKDKGKMIVGLDDSYPPMGFRNEKNEVAGFDIDLAREVGTRLGVTVEFQPIDWDSKEMELSSGKIDCVWSGMTITDERLASMFFAKPYIANEQIIIVPSDSGITAKAQLEGKVVGLQKGSSSLDALNADPVGAKVKQIAEYPDNVSAYMDLKARRIDAFVVDSVVGRYMIAQAETGSSK